MSATYFQNMLGILGGDSLLERLAVASIEVAVLAGLLWLLCRLQVVKSPRLCALLWIVVLAKPLMSLAIGSPMPVVAIERPADLREIVLFAPQDDLDAMLEEQFARDREQLDRIAAARIAIPSLEPDEAPLAATAAQVQPSQSPTSPVTQNAGWSLSSILLSIWGAGVFVMVGIILIDMLKLQRLHRRGSDAPQFLHEMADAIAHDIGLRRTPQLRVIAGLDSPALVGTLRPTVFLPCWLTEESNANRAAWLLRHELMHARHGDSIALLLRRAAESLFFFHPVVWFAGRQWEEATELACDRALIADNDQARDYARQLLGVLETCHVQRPMAMSPGLFATRTQIGRRIAALLANPLQHPARLSVAAIAIVLFGGVATVSLGLGIRGDAPAQERTVANEVESEAAIEWVAPKSRETMHEPMIKSLHSRVAADLRTMHTALESYRVDFRVYPQSDWQLTTPIAYLSSLPKDPFVPFAMQQKDPATGEALPYAGRDTYHVGIAPDFTELLIYSIGPDGRDNGGVISYDPANGTISEGDITRNIPLEDYYVFEDETLHAMLAPGEVSEPSMTQKVVNQDARLRAAAQTIRFWVLSNKKMPESWEEMTAADSNVVPAEDLFGGEGAAVKFILRDGDGIVYSVGPNGKDDGGRRIPNGRYSVKNLPDGDLSHTIKWEDVKKDIERMENPSAAMEEDGQLKTLLALKEETGRDNAMIHYQLASLAWPGLPAGDIDEEMTRLRESGSTWTRDSNKVLTYLGAWETSFAHIRKGAALDFAENVDPSIEGHATKVPNFLFAQTAARAMAAEGKYFESRGEFDRAIDNYVTILRMGRDYGSKNGFLISSLISVSIQSTGNAALSTLVVSGKLSETHLERLGREVAHVANTYLGVPEGLRGEMKSGEAGIRIMAEEIRAMSDQEFAKARGELQQQAGIVGLSAFTYRSRDALINWMESGAKELSELYRLSIELSELKPHEATGGFNEVIRAAENSRHPMVRIAMPNFMEASTRDYVMQSKRSILQIQIALERHRRFHSRYPERLVELEGSWIEQLPIDPFSGKPFEYHAFDDRSKYVLYGLGPQKRDDPEATTYDPTNGTVSRGVIY